MKTVLHLGDCRDVMRSYPAETFTAIVCDPPYALPGGFMGKAWDNFGSRSDVGLSYYLSGLIDGEGCFRVQRHERGTHTCTFSMKLRIDDSAILERAIRHVGVGNITKPDMNRTGNSKPTRSWVVQDKAGCARLVSFLRKFPLRAKKLRDFESWAEAVGEWHDRPRGNRWIGQSDQTKAASLKARVEKAREFRGVPWSGHPFQDSMREIFEECLRVLKPGGMLFAFGGTRTSHRLTCAIEDAGFEIRDSLAWLYAQGFPKSLAIDKGIDRRRDDLAEIYEVTGWIRSARDAAGLTNREIDGFFGLSGMSGHWTSSKSQPAVPKLDQWADLLALFNVQAPEEIEALVSRLNARKGEPGEDWERREVTGSRTKARSTSGSSALPTLGGDVMYKSWDTTDAATETSVPWQGYGTALKPAHEPCTVAMKPLAGTFAQNALEHGVAGLNVDGGRIGSDRVLTRHTRLEGSTGTWAGNKATGEVTMHAGRWPSNVAFDEPCAEALDRQGGHSTTPKTVARGAKSTGAAYGPPCSETQEFPCYGDSGGASRFFYVAKPSTAERTDGMEPGTEAFHPTTKPVELMRWIVRMCKMPEGTHILDPFAGSGTTGVACQMEGVDCTLVERDREYLETITVRRLRGPADTMFPPEVEVRGLDEDEEGAA